MIRRPLGNRGLSRRLRWWVALGFGLGALSAGVLSGPAFGDASPPPPTSSGGVISGPSAISVLAQTPWVTSGQTFQLRLQITADDPAADKLSVQVFSRLTTRTDFQNASRGRVPGFVRYPQVVQLSQLPTDPQGGVDLSIPVNPTAAVPAGSLPAFNAAGGSGVFPLQVSLADQNGAPLGKPLTTFLVYAAGDPVATGFPRLSVAVVIPVHASPALGSQGQLGPVSPADSAGLSQLAAVLARHADVGVNLAVTPQTLDALGAGSATDKATLAALASLSRSSDQVLPEPYANVSMDDLFSSGLGADFAKQVDAGQSVLGKVFGARPSAATWVLNGPVDAATLNALNGLGTTQFVLPDSDLSTLPLSSRQTTFASPTKLASPDRGGPAMNVYAADPALTSDFTSTGGSVLAASKLLAELSMIQLETPGVTRGVAVLPPPRWAADPTFVDTLLSGLSGHPLLQPSSGSGLFEQVKLSQVQRSLASPGGGAGSGVAGGSNGGSGGNSSSASGSGSSGGIGSGGGNLPSGNGSQTAGSGQGGLSSDASRIKAARSAIDALQGLLPVDTPSESNLLAELQDQLLVAESSDLTESQRQELVGAVNRETDRELGNVTLPGSSSITLTSTKGQIPLTILSLSGAHAKVELRLSSQRLIFRGFDPANGHCVVPTPTSEICQLVLAGQNTTLKVPVETRSSGVFPLDVSLWTPGGGQRLALRRDTVRSTAVSNVGVILIVLAIASLAVWWARDLRHGRRARKLVPPPVFDDPQLPDDPAVRDFFENPPPAYPEKDDSPARPRG